jgi:phenylalanyl-tRNA synthetase alpha chain
MSLLIGGKMIPSNIQEKIGQNLHLREGHPLNQIKNKIQNYFASGKVCHWSKFKFFDDFAPQVSIKDNFDDLLIPENHVSRSDKDTFYVDEDTVLRTHTSAHQNQLLRQEERYFLVTGDVYRRDTVDKTHYPVFHQMEGVWVPPRSKLADDGLTARKITVPHLHKTLEGLAKHLFGDVKCRWVDCYFPFTNPSWELEIFFNGEWLEVLGCGLIEKKILENNGMGDDVGWAFGLGLERLAMVLYQIPDIRLFWTSDRRFLDQFKDSGDVIFKPYSKYPYVTKDISFWISENYHENDFHQLIREVAGDLVEEVKLIDDFTHPKTQKTNHTYRVTYRAMGRNLTNAEINGLQEKIRVGTSELSVELR